MQSVYYEHNHVWCNDADTWYGYCDWTIAKDEHECNQLVARHEGITLEKVISRKYVWSNVKSIMKSSRYLCFCKNCPV